MDLILCAGGLRRGGSCRVGGSRGIMGCTACKAGLGLCSHLHIGVCVCVCKREGESLERSCGFAGALKPHCTRWERLISTKPSLIPPGPTGAHQQISFISCLRSSAVRSDHMVLQPPPPFVSGEPVAAPTTTRTPGTDFSPSCLRTSSPLCLISILPAEKTGARTLGSVERERKRGRQGREGAFWMKDKKGGVWSFEREHCVVPPHRSGSVCVI